ncbi:transcriptional regulator with XRE-family HTH domain [Saccharothrix coeruleofusca]|uniref:helix-turn-helix domain-containing protein n=1 Tax=Saccharothrix coeruleofusca TaxID=33919 RepID=UPI001FD49DD7|nr:helix-turn-helix transcriptional regulator [Saccharothrix coeruleofusca]MBP2339008.1 transcriptional regulator with XRE-family HTH domain [Saccharothrix coeruleofusca]
MPQQPTFRRKKLGHRVRRLREQAGMSIDEAARALEKQRGALYRIEAGETRLDVHLARSMMDIYDVYDPGLLDHVREALEPAWWRSYDLDDVGYVDMETEAGRVRELALINLPGLLQSEGYARAILQTSFLKRSEEELCTQIEVRQIRQRRLTAEQKPLRLTAVVDEIALHQVIDSPGVMVEQLNHLIMMSELSTVSLRIIPRVLGPHPGQGAAYTLLEFEEYPPMLYVENPVGSTHWEEPEKVSRATLLFDHLLDLALTPEDSVALIERIIPEHG